MIFVVCTKANIQQKAVRNIVANSFYIVQREKLRALFYRALDKLGCRDKLLIGMATIFHNQLHLDFDLNLFVYEFAILVCRTYRFVLTVCQFQFHLFTQTNVMLVHEVQCMN